jgi:hypothetical protein
MRHRRTWLLTRRHRAARAAAHAAEAAEQAAARQRILDYARRDRCPEWNADTTALPTIDRPLLTPGQAWRGHGGKR